MADVERRLWKVSLHGGHSVTSCDHAQDSLRDILEAAVAQGYHTFGVTEHAPRVDARFLYQEEIRMGWDVPKIIRDFEAYAEAVKLLASEFANRLTVLRGFEAEVVPTDGYCELMTGYRQLFGFDYMVGSVHWVDEVLIDGPREEFYRAAHLQGGVESLAVRYYQTVAEMVRGLKPEVVGHLDVVRKHAPSEESVATPAVRRAACAALEAIRENNCIVDVNTSGYRKGFGRPYPAPWLVAAARDMGIAFCFGDDSHCVSDVGTGIDQARAYLLELGVTTITAINRRGDALTREVIEL